MNDPEVLSTFLFLAIVVAGVAFLIGSIPFGLIVGRLFYGIDIRASGSGNIGAANALRTLGKGGALAVLVLDALKGFVPVFVVAHLLVASGSPYTQVVRAEIGAIAGFSALLGHCYSPLLRFRGGKGVATHLGVLFALFWPAALAFVAVWVAIARWTRYSSAGSLSATLASPAALWLGAGKAGLYYGAAAALVIFWRHRDNIARLRAGTENPMSLFERRSAPGAGTSAAAVPLDESQRVPP